jgi:endonuclease/exonuclease/phosphatase family metal-dependent hydrolase
MNNAVFSKYPIVDSKGHTLIEGRMGAVIEAKIKVGDEILSVFSVHLKHTHLKESEYQLEQARNLLKLVPKEKAIVMGDFNALPESNTVKLMSSALVNTDPSNKPTWSMYPDGCPVCEPDKLAWRFDYIFTTNDLKFNSAEVGESRASDHLPIFTILN